MKQLGLLFVVGLFLASNAVAQRYPGKAVRIIVPISAGSGLDIVGRLVSHKLSEMWGQPVVVDNRPGAGGAIGTAIVAKSPADGYTLLIVGNSHAVNPALYSNLPYDTVRDFVEIAPLAALYQALVIAPSASLKSVSALIDAAKARPGQLTFASPGVGSGVHFTGEKFKLAAGIDVVHVPYKGGPEAMTDVMMGRVTYWMPSIGTALPFVQSGKLHAIGVTSRDRSSLLPDVPTIAETGIAGFEDSLWFGMWAPARTPPSIVDRLALDVARALASPEVRSQLRKLAAEPINMTRVQFSQFVRTETETAARIARSARLKPQQD